MLLTKNSLHILKIKKSEHMNFRMNKNQSESVKSDQVHQHTVPIACSEGPRHRNNQMTRQLSDMPRMLLSKNSLAAAEWAAPLKELNPGG